MKRSVTVAERLRFAVRLILAELRLAGQRRHAVKDLKRLSNGELADIGITRYQIRDCVDAMLAGAVGPAPVAQAPARPHGQAEPEPILPEAA